MVGGADGGGAGTTAATSAGTEAGAGGGAPGASTAKRRTSSKGNGGASFFDSVLLRPALFGGSITFSLCAATVTTMGFPAFLARSSLFMAVL